MTTLLHAQPKASSPVGEYHLQGVMETASGFKLNADSSFQFLFAYGALDRFGEGTWSLQSDSIVFTSKQRPLHDFKLVEVQAGRPGKIILQFKNMHPVLLQHVHCKIISGMQEQKAITNSKGVASFDLTSADSIELFLEFCAEKKSVFTPHHKSSGLFVFEPEPWLMEIFFHNFRLKRTETGLRGRHPLSDKVDYFYKKTKM